MIKLIALFFFLTCIRACSGYATVLGDPKKYPVHRYSRYMGSFPRNCSVTNVPVVVIAPSDYMCDIKNFPPHAFEGLVLMTIGAGYSTLCKEERQYLTAEALGAVAYIDLFEGITGSTLFVHHAGFHLSEHHMPFVAISGEFYDTYFNPLIWSLINQSFSGVILSLDGCNDENEYHDLFLYVQPLIYGITGLFFLIVGINAISCMMSIQKTPMTMPRIVSLGINGILLMLNGFSMFAGFGNGFQYQWFFGGPFVPKEVADIFSTYFQHFNNYDTLIAAIYWRDLRHQCFDSSLVPAASASNWIMFLKYKYFLGGVLVVVIPFYVIYMKMFVARSLYANWNLFLFVNTSATLYIAFCGIYFWIQSRAFLKQTHLVNAQTTGVVGGQSSSKSLLRLAFHLNKCLQVFAALATFLFFNYIISFNILLTIYGARMPPYLIYTAVWLNQICYNLMGAIKVWGMRGPKRETDDNGRTKHSTIGSNYRSATTNKPNVASVHSEVSKA